MGSVYIAPSHQQVCWSVTDSNGQQMPAIDANEEDRSLEAEAYRKLISLIHEPGFVPANEILAPHPVLTDRNFLMRIQYFHQALVKAVVSIIDRWWIDVESNFPARMPLETPVEEALQYMDEQSRHQTLPAFQDRLGNWRPDFLITANDSTMGLGFQICEINSRTPDNMAIRSAHKNRKIRHLMGSGSALQPTGDCADWLDRILGQFDADKPIHIIRGRDRLDRQDFVQLVKLRTGICPRYVSLEDLEIKPDTSAATSFSLCCSRSLIEQDQGPPEKIYQAVPTLFPDEFSLLSQDILQQLGRLSVNDLRVSLLVNDQRFLGIVLQELDSLSSKHGILTPDEAKTLQDGIVPTLLPGSPELNEWIHNHQQAAVTKDDYILKAARQSRGRGHLIGADVSAQEWEMIMQDMQDPRIRPGVTSYVLQPFVRQVEFDLIGEEDRLARRSLMVGCYYTTNGRLLGLGPWRSSTGKICNVYGGGTCVGLYSVTQGDGH